MHAIYIHTLGFEHTSMASLDRWNIGGNLEYSLCCNMSGAPGKDRPPPTTKTLPYSFFFTSSDAKMKTWSIPVVKAYTGNFLHESGKVLIFIPDSISQIRLLCISLKHLEL